MRAKCFKDLTADERLKHSKSHRRPFRILQERATDNENCIEFSPPKKRIKLSSEAVKQITFLEKGVQTGAMDTAQNLNADDSMKEYWKALAEARGDDLEVSLREGEKLRDDVEILQEENKRCNAMLEEAKIMVEILKDVYKAEHEDDGEKEKRSSECCD